MKIIRLLLLPLLLAGAGALRADSGVASESNPNSTQLDTAAAVLTPCASAFRYPGGTYEPMPTRHEFDEARQHAQTIYDFVPILLLAEARPQNAR